MKKFRNLRSGVCACFCVALLTACTAGQLQSLGSGSQSTGAPQTRTAQSQPQSGGQRVPVLGRKIPIVRPDRRHSWISPMWKNRKTRLLFVSDYGSNDVYIFKLPQLVLLGTLTGFNGPQGECSDNAGHVWVTNTNSSQIFEYSHFGKLINTLTDPAGYPASCAWDQTTGNLAVTNFTGLGSTPGNVLVYTKASGTPAAYINPSQFYYYLAGYDPRGNLFFDGQDVSESFMLSELPKGSASAVTVTLSGGTIYWPGSVQWSSTSHYLSVGDQVCDNSETTCIYHVSVSGSAGTITGKTTLATKSGGPDCEVVQVTQLGNRIHGSDNEALCGNTNTTDTWFYPSGGNATVTSKATENYPEGAAISQ